MGDFNGTWTNWKENVEKLVILMKKIGKWGELEGQT